MPLTPTRAYFRPRNLKVLGMAALSSLLVWPAALPVSTTSAHSSAPSAPLASALPPASAVSSDKLNELREDYQKLPMSFEVNQGQAHSKVKYLSHSSGYNVLFTNNEVLLTMDATPPVKKTGKGKAAAKSTAPVADTVSLQFKGGNPSARIYGDRMMGKAHYFVGNDPAKWLRNITTYHNVRYEKVYPGVDVVYYGHDKKLEYDVIVAAGADPKTVRLNFGGVKNMRLNQNGELELTTAHGVVCQQKPVAYQLVNKLRQPVEVAYTINGRDIGFKVGAYDATKPLVIDPILLASSYLGGTGSDQGNAIAVDQATGQYYVAGNTAGSALASFPPVGSTLNFGPAGGGQYGFVSRVSSDGRQVDASFFFGGSVDVSAAAATNSGTGIAVVNSNNVYLCGTTNATDFPVTAGNAFQTTLSNDGLGTVTSDAYLTRFDFDLASLVYSTYLGGDSDENCFSVAVVGTNAFITGDTASAQLGFGATVPFPLSATPFQNTLNGSSDAFLTRLDTANSGATSLGYSTYLGGSSTDSGRSIAASTTIAYVGGDTGSNNFPTAGTTAPFDTTFNGGTDGFVTRLNTANPPASALQYSTYLGGTGVDRVFGVAVAGTTAFVTGTTTGGGFPTTPSAFQTTYGGGTTDAFMARINTATAGAASLFYSSFLGGTAGDAGNGIAVSGASAYVVGTTNSTNFPAKFDVQVTGFNGGTPAFSNAFVARFITTGSGAASLGYSTQIGGNGNNEEGYGIATAPTQGSFSGATDVVFTGYTRSGGAGPSGNGFPTNTNFTSGTPLEATEPPNSFQPAYGGGAQDAFYCKLSPATLSNSQAGLVVNNATFSTAFCTPQFLTLDVTATNLTGPTITGPIYFRVNTQRSATPCPTCGFTLTTADNVAGVEGDVQTVLNDVSGLPLTNFPVLGTDQTQFVVCYTGGAALLQFYVDLYGTQPASPRPGLLGSLKVDVTKEYLESLRAQNGSGTGGVKNLTLGGNAASNQPLLAGSGRQTSPVTASDPTNPNRVAVAATNYTTHNVEVTLTEDSGNTWRTLTLPTTANGTSYFGGEMPALAFSAKGELLVSSVLNNPESDANSLVLYRYANGRFSDPIVMAAYPAGNNVFARRPVLAAGAGGNTYLAWETYSTLARTSMIQVREVNGGLPATVAYGQVFNPTMVVTPGGQVFVGWNNLSTKSLEVASSRVTEPRVVFNPPVRIASTGLGLGTKIPAMPDAGVGPGLTLAVDPKNSKRVYGVLTGVGAGMDVFFATTEDAGSTWAVNRLSQEAIGDQFNPAISVSTDGLITVAFVSTSTSADNARGDVFVVRSSDGGKSFGTSAERISNLPSNASVTNSNRDYLFNLGYRLGVAQTKAAPIVVWTDLRNGSEDIFGSVLGEYLGGPKK